MPIKPLPPDVVAQLNSSSIITSLNDVALGLLRNSLDAQATKVNVSLDFRLGNCVVEDNGLGIPAAEFQETGALGKLHFTSKHPTQPHIYGRTGEFLHSVASLSLLLVTSHHRREHSHNTLVFQNSHLVSRHVPALPDQRILAFPHGTRVTVRDLFGWMPVRVKQRALDADRSGSSRDWDRLVRMLVSLLLGFPGNVSVAVRELRSAKSLTLRSDGSSLLSKTSCLLARAALWQHTYAEDWVPLAASSSAVAVDGCISLVPAASRRLQFVTIGMSPLQDRHRCNIVFDEINRVFADSSFGAVQNDGGDDPENPDHPTGSKKDTRVAVGHNKVRKGVDRWPVFYLRITLQDRTRSSSLFGQDSVLDDGNATLPQILVLLKAMCYAFLKKHDLCPQRVGFSTRPSRSSPSKRSVRSGKAPATRLESPVRPTEAGDNQSTTQDCVGYAVKRTTRLTVSTQSRRGMFKNLWEGEGTDEIAIHPSHAPSTASKNVGGESSGSQLGVFLKPDGAQVPNGCFQWTDPTSKTLSPIDARTGFVMKPKEATSSCLEQKEVSPWLKGILSQWENPVFEPVKASIPRLAGASSGFDDARPRSPRIGSCLLSLGHRDDTASLVLEGRFSKSSLRSCEVVGQVDQKFILAKLQMSRPANETETVGAARSDAPKTAASSVLVVIDQHAADERCRVESLMRDYFEVMADGEESEVMVTKPVIATLAEPITYHVCPRDGILLERFWPHFDRWGIAYEVDLGNSPVASGGHAGTLCVTGLPPPILERCRSEPKMLLELLRHEIWRLESDEALARAALASATARVRPVGPNKDEGHNWVPWFHGCPPGILDLINSRACRSAIMFGDVLSLEECRALVDQLAQCAFPFQCAHGRPSVVSLLDLGATEPNDEVIPED